MKFQYQSYNCPACGDGHDFLAPVLEAPEVEIGGEKIPLIPRSQLGQVVTACPNCGEKLKVLDYFEDFGLGHPPIRAAFWDGPIEVERVKVGGVEMV